MLHNSGIATFHLLLKRLISEISKFQLFVLLFISAHRRTQIGVHTGGVAHLTAWIGTVITLELTVEHRTPALIGRVVDNIIHTDLVGVTLETKALGDLDAISVSGGQIDV